MDMPTVESSDPARSISMPDPAGRGPMGRAAEPLRGLTLPVARYRFKCRLAGTLRLPDFAGSMLRGAFGAALRRSACMTGAKSCDGCPLYRSCPYPAIFETPPRPTALTQEFSRVPNPYVIEPPSLGTRDVADELEFALVLVGPSTLRLLPLIVFAWQRALRHGLGKQRVPGQIEAVHWIGDDGRSEPVFDAEHGQVLPHEAGLQVPEAPEVDRLTLCIETPLRLQSQGRALREQELTVRTLALAAVRRATLMLELHAGVRVDPDIAAILADIDGLLADRRTLRWHDWTRYSSRQRQEMQLGGLLGEWTIEGPVRRIWPWLWLGQWLHVGKNATMGLGRFGLYDG